MSDPRLGEIEDWHEFWRSVRRCTAFTYHSGDQVLWVAADDESEEELRPLQQLLGDEFRRWIDEEHELVIEPGGEVRLVRSRATPPAG